MQQPIKLVLSDVLPRCRALMFVRWDISTARGWVCVLKRHKFEPVLSCVTRAEEHAASGEKACLATALPPQSSQDEVMLSRGRET